jgi:hypothetical protein
MIVYWLWSQKQPQCTTCPDQFSFLQLFLKFCGVRLQVFFPVLAEKGIDCELEIGYR